VFRLRREIEAMAYVQSHASVPIPIVLEAHVDDQAGTRGCFLMARLPGQQLGRGWSTMPESARAQSIRQFKTYLDQLHHSRPAPPGWAGSCSQGPAYDHRIEHLSDV